MLDVPTTRVAYVKVTPTISNWIQPIAIGSRSNPPRDVDRTDRDPIAIELQVWTALRLDRDPVASVDRPQALPDIAHSGLYAVALDVKKQQTANRTEYVCIQSPL